VFSAKLRQEGINGSKCDFHMSTLTGVTRFLMAGMKYLDIAAFI
jgi:hypothetical protein